MLIQQHTNEKITEKHLQYLGSMKCLVHSSIFFLLPSHIHTSITFANSPKFVLNSSILLLQCLSFCKSRMQWHFGLLGLTYLKHLLKHEFINNITTRKNKLQNYAFWKYFGSTLPFVRFQNTIL